MKNLFIVVILTLCTLLLNGQKKIKDFDIKWGENVRDGNYIISDVIGKNNDNIFLIKSRTNKTSYDSKVKIAKINGEGDQLKVGRILDITNNHQYQFSFQLNSKLFVCMSEINPREKTISLYANEVDTETCGLKEGKKLIGKLKFEGAGKLVNNVFFHTMSEDSSKIAIFYKTTRRYKIKGSAFEFVVLNSELEELNRDDVYLKYGKDAVFQLRDYIVDNNGNFFMLGAISFMEGNVAIKKQSDIKFFDIMAFYKNKENYNQKIELENKLITQMKLKTSGNSLFGIGFYSEQLDKYQMAGVFSIKYNISEKKLISTKINDFSLELMNSNLSERIQKRNKRIQDKYGDLELKYLKIRELHNTAGGIVVVCEENNLYEAHYYDILVFKIDNNNEMNWIYKLPKRQYKGKYCSFLTLKNNNNVYVLFNDTYENVTKEKDKIYGFDFYVKDKYIAAYKINEEGNIQRYVVESNSKMGDLFFKPLISSQLNENEAIIICSGSSGNYVLNKGGVLKFNFN